jgi:hypothetical protein
MDLPIRTDVESFVIVGVDTHADAHVAVALDGLGVGASATRPCPQRRPATPHCWLGRRNSGRWTVPASKAAAASAWD